MTAAEKFSEIIQRICQRVPQLRKALDKTRLVQVPVKYKKKDGTMGTRLQWVDRSSKEAKEHSAHREDKTQPQGKKTSGASDDGNTQNTYAKTTQKDAMPDTKAGARPKKQPKPIGTIRIMEGMHMVESSKDVPGWIIEQTGKIPPGWRFVQIADDKDADKLVCGYDYEGRLQVKYSARHTQKQAAEKFRRVAALRENEKKIADGIKGIKNADVRDCLLLIMETGLRPGSAASAKGGHYGATTLKAEHVVIEKSRVYLRFIGKEGVIHNHEVMDPDLRKMLKRRKKEAEKREDKRLFNAAPETLNKQFKAVTGAVDTSVKDLRTMKACSTAYKLLKTTKPVTTAKGFASLRNRIGEEVCQILGNGREMALGSYIDPRLFIAHSPAGYRKWQESKKKERSDETEKSA